MKRGERWGEGGIGELFRQARSQWRWRGRREGVRRARGRRQERQERQESRERRERSEGRVVRSVGETGDPGSASRAACPTISSLSISR